MKDYSELKRLAEAANSEFPLAPWAYEPHGDTGTYGIGVLQNDQELCVTGRQEPGEMLVVEPVATDVVKEKYAAFIAACSPGIVLGLISALESKSGFLDDFIQAHKSLVSQREQLKAEVEGLCKDSDRLDWIEDNYEGSGGGQHFDLRLHIPHDIDEGGLRHAIDAVIAWESK